MATGNFLCYTKHRIVQLLFSLPLRDNLQANPFISRRIAVSVHGFYFPTFQRGMRLETLCESKLSEGSEKEGREEVEPLESKYLIFKIYASPTERRKR